MGFLKAVNRLLSEEAGGQPMSESTGGFTEREEMSTFLVEGEAAKGEEVEILEGLEEGAE